MIISKIVTKEFIYINLHAEEAITSNFIEDDNSGIFGDRLQIVTIQRAFTSLKAESSTKNFVLDFNLLKACQHNLNREIINLKVEGYKILFLNLKKELCDELSLTAISNSKNILHGDIYSKYYFFEDSNESFLEAQIEISKLFNDKFKEKLKSYIKPHDKPHTSSFVYLSSYVDMKRFISHDKEFVLFALYKLAIKIKNEWKLQINEAPILICQSMNSAYVVSILSNFLKLDILILDKIGPVNKLYNHFNKNISDKRKYANQGLN